MDRMKGSLEENWVTRQYNVEFEIKSYEIKLLPSNNNSDIIQSLPRVASAEWETCSLSEIRHIIWKQTLFGFTL